MAVLHEKGMGRDGKNVRNGYPDMGNGRFSTRRMISYGQWLQINIAQRGHKGFLQQLTPVLVMTLVCGLELPVFAIIFSGLFGVFRLFTFRRGRLNGFVPAAVCLGILTLGSLYSITILIFDVLSVIDDYEKMT